MFHPFCPRAVAEVSAKCEGRRAIQLHLLPREAAVGFANDPRPRTPVGTPRMPPALAEQPCGRRTKSGVAQPKPHTPLASAYKRDECGPKLALGARCPQKNRENSWGTRGWEQLICMDMFISAYKLIPTALHKVTAVGPILTTKCTGR